MRKSKSEYYPILWIDESIEEHFTQILYILKESFADKDKGFTGWKTFSKKYLFDICKKDYWIYKTEWGEKGKIFTEKFPEKINKFLELYCEKE